MKPDLYKLFTLLAHHGFTYVDGGLKGLATADNTAYIDVSTQYNGRGDSIGFEFSNLKDCHVTFDFRYTFGGMSAKEDMCFHKHVPASKLYKLVVQTLKEYGFYPKV